MALVVDWAEAFKIGGVGFGLVFAVLIILAVALWVTGMVFKKLDSGKKEEAGKDKKGA